MRTVPIVAAAVWLAAVGGVAGGFTLRGSGSSGGRLHHG